MAGITKRLSYANHLSMLGSVALTFLLTFLFARRDKIRLQEVGVVPDSRGIFLFLAGFTTGLVMVLIQVLILSNFAPVKFIMDGTTRWENVAVSLLLYLLIACREELVFRGYPLRKLSNSISPSAAVLIITVLFILEHVMAGVSWKMSIIGSGLGGLLYGIAAVKSKGLALPIGLHFSWNFTQWLLGFKNETGVWRELVEKGRDQYAENVALVSFSIVMILAIAGIVSFSWKNTQKIQPK